MKDYEVNLFAQYLLNAVDAWRNDPNLIRNLAMVAEFHSDTFGVDYSFPKKISSGKKPTEAHKSKLDQDDIKSLQAFLTKVVKKTQTAPLPDEYVFLEKLFQHLDYDETDRKIAELILLSVSGVFSFFFSQINGVSNTPASLDIIPAFLGQDKKKILPHLRPESPLLNGGMIYAVTRDYDDEPVTDKITYHLHEKILTVIDNEEFSIPEAMERLIGKARLPETEWTDFDHIRKDAEYAAQLITSALREKTSGINLLVYGDTGTGKTEFCRVLAAHLGVPLYAVGEKEELESDYSEGGSRDRSDPAFSRLADKRLVENMLGRRGAQALVMFDEMEDVLRTEQVRGSRGNHSSTVLSKSATNNLLTENTVPCLWTTNNIWRYDQALLRRFAFTIELKTPNADVRERVILRTLKRYGVELTSTQVRELADEHSVPPALFARAIESAALVGKNTDDGTLLSGIQIGLRNTGRLVTTGPKTKVPRPVEQYDLGLVNAGQDLAQLTDQIVRGQHRNFSICGYGVSGAGKSEFMVYLAHKMELEALLVPYSDVGSAYVSETEQNIRIKFEQASDEGKFLIFDEADSLLADRRNATHSWEKTVVNEMLTRMERHKFPLACTTNLMDEIDRATLRRFVFKIRFNGLTNEQSRKAYQVYFKHELPEGVRLPDVIAPGDFSNVLRQARILGTLDDTQWLVKALRAECAEKGASRPIGFGRSLDIHRGNDL